VDSIGHFDSDGIWNAENKTEFKLYLQNNAGKKSVLKVKRHSAKRSDPQNRYYWSVVCKKIGDHLGYDSEEIHEILKSKFNAKVLDVKEGEQIAYGGSTTKLSKTDFMLYLDEIKRWSMIEFGLYIPDPNEVIYES
jgi:hypothetical protein